MAKVVWMIKGDKLFENWKYKFYFPAKIKVPKSMEKKIFSLVWANDEDCCAKAKELYHDGDTIVPVQVLAYSEVVFEPITGAPSREFVQRFMNFDHRCSHIEPGDLSLEDLVERERRPLYDFEFISEYGLVDMGDSWFYSDTNDERWENDYLQYLLAEENRNKNLRIC